MSYRPSFFIAIVLTAIVIGLILERNLHPTQTTQYREVAVQYGLQKQKETPPRQFYFDGCTLFPDQIGSTSFLSACLNHDIAYWYGGTVAERKAADQTFRQEVANSGQFGTWLQWPMYGAVRLFGDTFVLRPFNANWGFGYNE